MSGPLDLLCDGLHTYMQPIVQILTGPPTSSRPCKCYGIMIACLRGQEGQDDGDDAMVICAGGPEGAHRSALRALGGHTQEKDHLKSLAL